VPATTRLGYSVQQSQRIHTLKIHRCYVHLLVCDVYAHAWYANSSYDILFDALNLMMIALERMMMMMMMMIMMMMMVMMKIKMRKMRMTV
jgi:hypothetical protein